jgi:thioredoxin-related protein
MKTIFFLLLSSIWLNANNFEWQEGLRWQHSLKDGKQLAQYHKKPIFMFLESRSCFYCPKLKKEVLSKKEFQEKIKKYFIPVFLDNAVDADSDVDNTGHVPKRLAVSMTPAIYFMGPKEEMLARKGTKHMIAYGMWSLNDMLDWMDDALDKFEKLHGEKYDFKK